MALLDAATDKDSEVQEQVRKSMLTLGKQQPDRVLAMCQDYLLKHPKVNNAPLLLCQPKDCVRKHTGVTCNSKKSQISRINMLIRSFNSSAGVVIGIMCDNFTVTYRNRCDCDCVITLYTLWVEVLHAFDF